MLRLWAAVIAKHVGFDRDEVLTLGMAVAGLNAHAKRKTLGLFSPTPEDVRRKRKEMREREGKIAAHVSPESLPWPPGARYL